MTPAEKIINEAAGKLMDLGSRSFCLIVRDPDSNMIWYRNGNDIEWAYGACERMKVTFQKGWEQEANARNRKQGG